MRLEERFIRAIREKQAEHAAASLSRPTARDAFEFGRVNGIYVGLALALTTIENILNEDKEAENEQSRRSRVG